jgi:hypothetical protein
MWLTAAVVVARRTKRSSTARKGIEFSERLDHRRRRVKRRTTS